MRFMRRRESLIGTKGEDLVNVKGLGWEGVGGETDSWTKGKDLVNVKGFGREGMEAAEREGNAMYQSI